MTNRRTDGNPHMFRVSSGTISLLSQHREMGQPEDEEEDDDDDEEEE